MTRLRLPIGFGERGVTEAFPIPVRCLCGSYLELMLGLEESSSIRQALPREFSRRVLRRARCTGAGRHAAIARVKIWRNRARAGCVSGGNRRRTFTRKQFSNSGVDGRRHAQVTSSVVRFAARGIANGFASGKPHRIPGAESFRQRKRADPRMKMPDSKRIDAPKKFPGKGFKRTWPPLIKVDESVKEKVGKTCGGK